jgi:hypothetical protein
MLESVRPSVSCSQFIHLTAHRTTESGPPPFCLNVRRWSWWLNCCVENVSSEFDVWKCCDTGRGWNLLFYSVCSNLEYGQVRWNDGRQIKLTKLRYYAYSRLCVFLNCKRLPRKRNEGPEGELEIYLYCFSKLGIGWRWVKSTARPLYPGKETWYSRIETWWLMRRD